METMCGGPITLSIPKSKDRKNVRKILKSKKTEKEKRAFIKKYFKKIYVPK